MATQTEIADKLGISDRWLRKLIDDGVVSAAKRGEFDFPTVAREYIAHQAQAIERLKADLASKSAEVERFKDQPNLAGKQENDARRAKALADKVEIEVAEMRGQLVPADQIADAINSAVEIMKSRVRGVPTKIAPQIGAKDIALAEKVIRGAIDEALDELSKVTVKTSVQYAAA